MIGFHDIAEVLKTEAKFLAFRNIKPNMTRHRGLYLGLGMIAAWLAGIGRYWDNPRALPWQYWGLGSVVYIFVLAAALWLIVLPLRPQNWRFTGVLTFVGMTSPPAFLYAIPVEQFTSLETAQTLNLWFLLIVAAWRVALLFVYLARTTKLKGVAVFIAGSLPLVLIVTLLAMLNLEHVIIEFMGGLSKDVRSSHDTAYLAVLLITMSSHTLAPFVFLVYAAFAFRIFDARLEGDRRGGSSE